jgi:hypothetical protein
MSEEDAGQQDGDEVGWGREALGCLGDGCILGCLPAAAGLSVVLMTVGYGLWQAVHPYLLA